MKPGTNKLLDFLHGLYRFQTTEMLSRFICQQLPLLLPCENVGLVEHDGKHRILTSLVAQHPLSATPLMPHINESGVASTHPFWQTIFDPARPVQHITDVTSKTDWLNNAFYCEVFKQDGLEGHIKMEVFGNRDRFTSINILRSNQTFSREDIELLKGLYPHFLQAYQHAHLVERAGLITIESEGREPPHIKLSPREAEILDWVAAGKSNDDIACILKISLNTVKTHLKRIFMKLGVENRMTAVAIWKLNRVAKTQ